MASTPPNGGPKTAIRRSADQGNLRLPFGVMPRIALLTFRYVVSISICFEPQWALAIVGCVVVLN